MASNAVQQLASRPYQAGLGAPYSPTSSPFLETRFPLTTYEVAKVVVLWPLAVVRVVSALLILAAVSLVSRAVLLYNGSEASRLGPLSQRVVRLAVRTAACALLLALGITARFEGLGNAARCDRRCAIGVFNHVSYIDALLVEAVFAASGVAKAGVAEYPLVGSIARGLQLIFVARKGIGDSERFAHQGSAVDLIVERSGDPTYPIMCLAPEGTCSDGKCLLKFRTGAFVAGRPVIPILLSYPHRYHNPAWTICNTALHVLRMLCQVHTPARCRLLPVYEPSDQERADPELYAANVRALMARELDVPLVEQGGVECHTLIKEGFDVDASFGRIVRRPPRGRTSSSSTEQPERAPSSEPAAAAGQQQNGTRRRSTPSTRADAWT